MLSGMNQQCRRTSKALLGLFFLISTACQSAKQPQRVASISTAKRDPQPDQILKDRSPRLLSFGELQALLRNPENKVLQKKARKLFSSPFIDNSAFRKKGIPAVSKHSEFGPVLRVSSWNIEKSLTINDVAEVLNCEEAFREDLKQKTATSSKKLEKALRQRAKLAASDILLTQEMDLGNSRSEYVFAAKKLAEELGMNFVFAPQQLEIDPVYLGLDQEIDFPHKTKKSAALDGKKQVDQSKYKGVFGVAVLSRYPIKKVQCFPLETPSYDWYSGEIKKPDVLELYRRMSAKTLFHSEFQREVKMGGRGFTRVDLHVPNVPHETVSVINVHLEIKVEPRKRVEQLKEILSYIKEIENPVVLAGDFNSASRDISATSVYRFVSRASTNPSNMLSAGLSLANTVMINPFRQVLNEVKNFQDPLAWNLPVVLPNNTNSLFRMLKEYRFSDGGAFDFRGDQERSVNGNTGILANSNQRSNLKGFTYTFNLPRPIGPFGRERLDWMFVKSFLSDSTDKKGSYRLAPHHGETLSLMNTAVKKRYSDHHPITVLLPLSELKLKK